MKIGYSATLALAMLAGGVIVAQPGSTAPVKGTEQPKPVPAVPVKGSEQPPTATPGAGGGNVIAPPAPPATPARAQVYRCGP
jgi:hypothetical protein